MESSIEAYLTNLILSQRRTAATLITKHVKRYLTRLKLKKYFIIHNILSTHNNAAITLNQRFKVMSYQSQVKHIFALKEKCYSIISSISDRNLMLKLYLYNGKIYTTQFKYCAIQKANVAYVPRNEIVGLLAKAHFVTGNGQIIVDPKFANCFEDNQFYNKINFRHIMQKEKEEKEERERVVKLICCRKQMGMGIKLSTSMGDLSLHGKKSLSKYGKNFSSMTDLNLTNSLKGILKQRPAKRIGSNKRISFGSVQFSY